MSRLKQLKIYKKHLKDRYNSLIETSNDYKFVDESKSDVAAFKALKVLEKLNKVNYLDREIVNTFA